MLEHTDCFAAFRHLIRVFYGLKSQVRQVSQHPSQVSILCLYDLLLTQVRVLQFCLSVADSNKVTVGRRKLTAQPFKPRRLEGRFGAGA